MHLLTCECACANVEMQLARVCLERSEHLKLSNFAHRPPTFIIVWMILKIFYSYRNQNILRILPVFSDHFSLRFLSVNACLLIFPFQDDNMKVCGSYSVPRIEGDKYLENELDINLTPFVFILCWSPVIDFLIFSFRTRPTKCYNVHYQQTFLPCINYNFWADFFISDSNGLI